MLSERDLVNELIEMTMTILLQDVMDLLPMMTSLLYEVVDLISVMLSLIVEQMERESVECKLVELLDKSLSHKLLVTNSLGGARI